jgi:hypothetical protein
LIATSFDCPGDFLPDSCFVRLSGRFPAGGVILLLFDFLFDCPLAA